MNTGDLQYGAKVHVCPRCRTPYVDPKIIELAAVPERDRAGHRMRYARQLDKRLALFAAAMMTLAASMFLSGALVQGFWPLLLIFAEYRWIIALVTAANRTIAKKRVPSTWPTFPMAMKTFGSETNISDGPAVMPSGPMNT